MPLFSKDEEDGRSEEEEEEEVRGRRETQVKVGDVRGRQPCRTSRHNEIVIDSHDYVSKTPQNSVMANWSLKEVSGNLCRGLGQHFLHSAVFSPAPLVLLFSTVQVVVRTLVVLLIQQLVEPLITTSLID